eukprot:6179034-Pleurochrysis_carterae.AAC.4
MHACPGLVKRDLKWRAREIDRDGCVGHEGRSRAHRLASHPSHEKRSSRTIDAGIVLNVDSLNSEVGKRRQRC